MCIHISDGCNVKCASQYGVLIECESYCYRIHVYFSSPELFLEFKTVHFELPIPHLLLDILYGDFKLNTSKIKLKAFIPNLGFFPLFYISGNDPTTYPIAEAGNLGVNYGTYPSLAHVCLIDLSV